MSVLLILGRFYRKRTKNSKIWVISKVHAAAKGSFTTVWPRRRNRTVMDIKGIGKKNKGKRGGGGGG